MTFALGVLPETAWVPCATAVDQSFSAGTCVHAHAPFSPQHSPSAESTRLGMAHTTGVVEAARSSENKTKHGAMSLGSAHYRAV